MGLHKGQTNNVAGRPKGAPNKITTHLREMVSDFLSDNLETMQADYDSMEPKERLMFYEKLLQYGLPKLQHTQLETEPQKLDPPTFIFKNLNE